MSEERDEDDRDEDGCDVLDHDTPRRTPTERRGDHDLVLDDLRLDAPTYKDAGKERYDRHHDGVRNEVEEVEQRAAFAERLNERQAVIAQIDQDGSSADDNEREQCRLLARALRAVMHDRNTRLGERDRRRERCEDDEQEEQHTDDGCEIAEAREHLWQYDEHKTRARILSDRLRGTQGNERCWHDHETSQEGHADIEARNANRARGERVTLLHIGTVGDHDTHRDREREEHLPQRSHHELDRERREIRDQIICSAIECARLAQCVYDQNDGHDDERWHHDEVRLLDTAFDAARHNEEYDEHEDEQPDIRLKIARDEAREVIAAITDSGRSIKEIGAQIFRHPATDHAVIWRDDERNERSQDADEGVLLAKHLERADSRLTRLSTKSDLDEQKRQTKGEYEHQVREQEHTAAILRSEIWETPKVTQTDR